jgi:hypothetical protein
MTDPIKIIMSKEDADFVEKLFDQKENPGFTIISKIDSPSGETCQLCMCFESSIDLWFLAKTVESYQSHDRRVAEIIEDSKIRR